MNLTLTITEIVAILGLGLSFAGVVSGFLWKMWQMITKNKTDIDRDLAAFRLEVAQQYASYSQLKDLEEKIIRTEERLLAGINALTTRMDRILNKMDDRE